MATTPDAPLPPHLENPADPPLPPLSTNVRIRLLALLPAAHARRDL